MTTTYEIETLDCPQCGDTFRQSWIGQGLCDRQQDAEQAANAVPERELRLDIRIYQFPYGRPAEGLPAGLPADGYLTVLSNGSFHAPEYSLLWTESAERGNTFPVTEEGYRLALQELNRANSRENRDLAAGFIRQMRYRDHEGD